MSIKTKLIDPSIYSESSNLCVFELGDYNTTYLSSMRLMNLGIHGANFTNADRYNSQAGVLGMIEQITLFDGGVVLSQLNSANVWSAFKSVNRDNSDAFTMRHMYQDMTSLSLNNRLGDSGAATQSTQTYPLVSDYRGSVNVSGAPLTTDALSAKGYVDLRVLLKGLQNMRYLPTMIFKKLRLEIIWSTTPANLLADVTRAAGLLTCRPVLMVDCISDPQTQMEMMESMKQVVFDEIEVERAILPVSAAGAGVAEDVSNFILRNYDNKYLKRLLVASCPIGDTGQLNGNVVLGGGPLGSSTLYQPNYQVVVNGSNKLAGAGLTKANEVMAYCTDTWGDISASSHSYLAAYNDCAAAEVLAETSFTRAYMGVRVEDNVSNLQLNIGRSGTGIAALDVSRNVHVFGEVTKVLQIADDGTYNIRYI